MYDWTVKPPTLVLHKRRMVGRTRATGVVERYCQMDDEFIFYDDGTFSTTQGDVWAESYMGGNNECLTDESLVSPFDVFGSGTHAFSATDTITVNGLGAFIGFNKAAKIAERRHRYSGISHHLRCRVQQQRRR